jgi:hypothetical protein
MVTWDRTPLGLETAAPVSRALRWLWKGSERRWNLLDEGSGAAPGG